MRIRFVIAAGILSLTAVGQPVLPVPSQGRVELLNEPFSADAVTTLVRTLPDGTHIARQTMTVKMYRDSAGRSRSDRIPGKFFAGQPAPPPTILISDPIAGYSYVLETSNKIARRSPFKSAQAARTALPLNELTAAPAAVTNNAGPQVKTEDLGTQTMEGLVVEGRRVTVITPAGAIGNDRDIANVSEIWSNKELRLMILQIRSDPRNGETTTKIENLNRTQPDPSLFLPPSDYKVVDVATAQ
jgi:hypothetical protein